MCLAGKLPFFKVSLGLLEEIRVEPVSQIAIEVFQFNDPVVVLVIDKLEYGLIPVGSLNVDEVVGLHHKPHRVFVIYSGYIHTLLTQVHE